MSQLHAQTLYQKGNDLHKTPRNRPTTWWHSQVRLLPAMTPLILSAWAFEHQIGPLEDCAAQGQNQDSESSAAGPSGK